MDQPQTSPENLPASEVEVLLYRLQSLFLEYEPTEPGPWGVRRYVDGRKENPLSINHSPDTGVYLLGACIENPSLASGYEVISDTLTPMGRFLGDPKAEGADKTYDERRAKQFNDLLVRSTNRPYGRLGRMLIRTLRERYRWSI